VSDQEPNEIAAVADAKAAKERAMTTNEKKNWPIAAIGLGVGIGSAALAAAVMFAGRKKD
jgi:hypothetical protein